MSPDPLLPREDLLDSWKEIAAYLKRDVRTVQRWEKTEGLPVQRHLHAQRGTVFAHRDALDAWSGSRTRATQPTGEVPLRPARALTRLAPLAGLVLLGGLYLLSQWLRSSSAPPVDSGQSRLLVLPLQTIGTLELDESLCHGLHEALIAKLARLDPARLAVIGRTTSLHYAANHRGMPEIGAELGLDYVLEGFLRQSEGQIEASLSLIQTRTESQAWSHKFQLNPNALLAAEERVAREVAERIGFAVFGLHASLAGSSSPQPEAQAAWLRGRYLWHKGNIEDCAASLAHYEQALGLDPDFVAAHVGLADAFNMLGRSGARPAHEVFPKALAAAERALERDPKCAEAHAARASVSFFYEWDFRAAAHGFQRALNLASGVALIHHSYAQFLSYMSLHEEALGQMHQAQALEPMWTMAMSDAPWFYYRARRYETALEESRRVLELEPKSYSAKACEVACLIHLGNSHEAWSTLRSYLEVNQLLEQVPGADIDDPIEAMRMVRLWEQERLQQSSCEGFVAPFSHVLSMCGLKRADGVFEWLDKALEARDRSVLLIDVHPAFDFLRDDPRFPEFRNRVGFPQDARELLDSPD